MDRHVDVLVVGSGATGSAMAAYLAEGGKSVLLLEGGRARGPQELVSSGLNARRLKWTGSPVTEAGAHPIGHVFNSAFGLGGAGMHHYAVWPRLHPEDFTMRSDHGRGADWPFGYDALAPFYDRVQIEAGVSGDAEQEIWRPPGAPYPMQPVNVFAQGRVIARGFEKLGRRVAPLPMAVTSQPYRGRPACLYDGWCDAGCPIGALANPLTVFLPRAQARGAEVWVGHTVTQILMDPSGRRAVAVEAVDVESGAITRVRADVVVLAAFSVENARLLLASRDASHPSGIGNAHDQVGRYVTSHTAGLVYGLFDEPTDPTLGAFGGQLLNQDHYPKRSHADPAAFGSYQWMLAQAVRPNDLLGMATARADLIGPALETFMQRAAHGFAGMTAVVEDLPLPENRVTLQAAVDRMGVPLATVTHTMDPASGALWQASLADGRAVFGAAGAVEVWTGPPGRMHIMGGTVMGDDVTRSVTDGFGRVHATENLYIAGPSLFPTSGGVNPTFTALALTARTASHLLAEWPTA
jgi:choline dehydrogenase-like flavoprotein